ncbi:pilus assembly protein CpaF [Anaerosporobacter mobilis DSM 15930]|uniref:Pilus assembly protein CpaF n=2 Tax=Anaerosporobacter TaxID=653683 RepID=A0A1M7MEA2_9FIRM|nr:CpaF family protein [Anaerosporobacter mobilis]SHM88666.1 pilus assembly protein CpaF [Anaerosporobacter mobilis DSM 15930]
MEKSELDEVSTLVEIKTKIKQNIMKQITSQRELADEQLVKLIDQEILSFGEVEFITIEQKVRLRKELYNTLRRLDVLQELVEDSTVTEIMINGAKNIFIERRGRITKCDQEFESDSRLQDVIQTIVSGTNRIVNESSPIVDARLEDGSRVNVVLPPIALDGPILTIRKFPDQPITMEGLIGFGALTPEVANFLRTLVEAKYNIFISGGTGSGKTTFLNALSNYIPEDERIITIEDSAELQIRSIANLVRLECRNANVEGKNAITIRDLIKSSLRMRPDRIVVGEIRDSAAIDLLAAYNTGHDGSLSTGHANSVKDMLNRLEALVLQGVDMPVQAIRKQISSAIDIIVHLGRLRDKSRKVLEISEVLEVSDDEIIVNPLYQFIMNEDRDAKEIGKLERLNNPLMNTEKLQRAGLQVFEQKCDKNDNGELVSI